MANSAAQEQGHRKLQLAKLHTELAEKLGSNEAVEMVQSTLVQGMAVPQQSELDRKKNVERVAAGAQIVVLVLLVPRTVG